MTEWMGMVVRAALRYVQVALREALAAVTARDVAGAKAQMEAAIQDQKRLPGTVRRWLCQDVRRIDARTVDQLRAHIEADISRLG
jgi:hypothetical protein